ncbi:MAG: hypothetical protein AABW92_02740 [Nanoarchaeota archaeon]
MKFSLTIALAIFLVFLIACTSRPSYPQEKVDEFAQCLTDDGTVMYGTFWCPHCAKVKKNFGTSFKNINYVECDPRGDNEQSELCLEKGIEKYATFEFSDGSRLIGEPTFKELSEKTGCSMPSE